MTVPASAPAGPGRSRHRSLWAPGSLPGAGLIAAAAALWPGFVRRLVPLEWQLGNIAPALLVLEILIGGAGILFLLRPDLPRRAWLRLFPTRRELRLKLLLLAVSVSLALALSEAVLRITGYPFRTRWTPSELTLARFDPDLGWSYIPDRTVTQRFGSHGRPIPMHFNDLGARVGEPGKRFDRQTPTVIFVGDSYTFGHGVTYEESFAGQFEKQAGASLQVVNLGVQGYGTDQSLLLLRRHLRDFNTKAVVYTFLLDHVKRNDNADRRLLFPGAKFLGTKPRFALCGGSLVEVERPRRYDDRRELRVGQALRLAWTKWGPSPSVPLTRALVRQMRDEVEASGAAFVLVLWTNRHALPPGAVARAFFPGLRVNVVDTGSGAPADWDSYHIPGEYHPDARAHAWVARLLAEKLRELGLGATP
ncbi:MAG TPA: SGNH/GDSL hydrolase family protein [Candidatus Polarisedimenticolia bacterium]|jgi:hypothetical protein|nr:SGNH/GDSL hydrolase family protein [Candidatus Polarisedimenticolia bacterium]